MERSLTVIHHVFNPCGSITIVQLNSREIACSEIAMCYDAQDCPSKIASANVPVNYLPRHMLRRKRITCTIAAAILYARNPVDADFAGALVRDQYLPR